MLVFVTGAAGFIGRATVEELIKHGHQVLGLSRSDANAEMLTNLGAQVHRGSLDDLESLKSGAKAADGIIHVSSHCFPKGCPVVGRCNVFGPYHTALANIDSQLAFGSDFSDFQKLLQMDFGAVEAIGEAIYGSGKPLVIASGTMLAVKGKLAAEDDEPETGTPFALRQRTADLVVKLSKENGVRGSVVRLPPTVHGKEDKGMIPMFAGAAGKLGQVPIIGDGSNRWPACHRLDAAVIFRLALEVGKPGGVYHAVAEQGVPLKDIMGVVGQKMNIPIKSKTVEEAMPDVGFLALVLAADNPTSSEKTQKELGWNPKGSGQPDLIADLEANYFN